MKQILFVFLSLFCLTFSKQYLTQEFVDLVNEKNEGWIAGMNEGSTIDGASIHQIVALLGVLPGGPELEEKTEFEVRAGAVPEEFSSITNWPQCATMKDIRDQSACGSCWAFAAVEAMSDRICIFLKKNVSLSSADLAFCCETCGDGCSGGYPAAAWTYYHKTGIVEEGCWPYPFKSCDHHVPDSKDPCPSSEYPNPNCASACDASWTGAGWNEDLHKASKTYSINGENNIMSEIFVNGPVEAAFTVYSDFLTYKSGVYKHVTGSALGGHAVKILGWGVENGQKYWLVANSWNARWGDMGFFKILRGVNECGIESQITAGVPA